MNLDYTLLVPEFVLLGLAAVVVALDLFAGMRRALPWVAAGGLAVALCVSLGWAGKESDFAGLIFVDDYTTFFRVLFIGIAGVVCLLSDEYVRTKLRHPGEYYGLIILSTIGAIYMAASRELLTAYISLELLSFSLYVLVSYAKFDNRSNEAGMKYILLGAFASAMFLYGLSLIYGATGTTVYAGIASALSGGTAEFDMALLLGLVLVLTGLGFKVAAVPFHMWTPDAYEGAPLPVTAYLSTASKAAGFALLLRLFSGAFQPVLDDWRWMVAALSAATMVFGNLVALQQTNIKRLLAYSSIGQVGFLLMGIAALSDQAASTLILHLTGYVITNLAVFACVIQWHNMTGHEDVEGFAGMAERAPLLAAALTGGLFSLAGMPLFAGFLTKFFLFQSATQQDLLWLASLAVVMSMVSLYYYLMVIKQLYVGKPEAEGRLPVPAPMTAVVFALSAGVFYVGIFPRHLFEAAQAAANVLFR